MLMRNITFMEPLTITTHKQGKATEKEFRKGEKVNPHRMGWTKGFLDFMEKANYIKINYYGRCGHEN